MSTDGKKLIRRRARVAPVALAQFAVLFCLFTPPFAQALEPMDAERLCRALVDEKPINQCLMAISGVPVDPMAVAACRRLKINHPISMCMRVISGKRYAPAEIEECDSLTNYWSTIKCFYSRGQRIAKQNFSGTYADQICPRLVTPRQVEGCVALFQIEYMQSSAALACDRINGSQLTADCLEAIARQRYTDAEVAACDSLPNGDDTVACFRRQPIVAEPTYAPPPPNYAPPPMYPMPGPRHYPPPQAGGTGGCNSYGCYGPGGGCNSYGCYEAGGGCNSYGCYRNGGGCNSYGCYGAYGGCNSYGCWRNGGGCNSYGCWHTPQGSCNSYGCSNHGECNSYGCPKAR